MSGAVNKPRPQTRKRMLFGMSAALIVLAVSFYGWVHKANRLNELNRQLLAAVAKKDSQAVRAALVRSADPNAVGAPQNLTLWQQIRYAFHADSRPDPHGYSALEQALAPSPEDVRRVDHVNVPTVEALLEAEARPNDCSHYGISPLMRAVGRGSLPTVQALLAHGANPMVHDLAGRYPIDFLTSNDSNALRIAELLVKLGNDVNASDRAGMTPLMYNMMHPVGDDKVVRFLAAQGANVNARSEFGFTALTMALSTNSVTATRFLLEDGADANICGHDNKLPLAWAAQIGEVREVGLLLEHGAMVDSVDKDGDTPLTSCLQSHDRPDTVKMLIAYGADVNHRNKAGQTPLSIAKKINYTTVIQQLEAAGAK